MWDSELKMQVAGRHEQVQFRVLLILKTVVVVSHKVYRSTVTRWRPLNAVPLPLVWKEGREMQSTGRYELVPL